MAAREAMSIRTPLRQRIHGWIVAVIVKHSVARNVHFCWKDNNLPQSRHLFENMTKPRKAFKYAFRDCHNAEEKQKADEYATAMCSI